MRTAGGLILPVNIISSLPGFAQNRYLFGDGMEALTATRGIGMIAYNSIRRHATHIIDFKQTIYGRCSCLEFV